MGATSTPRSESGMHPPHDVIREADILERLQNVPVPSPIVVGKCIDESVTGAPFFVMDFIDGAVLRDPEVVRAKIPYETRAGLAAELVRNLAALHLRSTLVRSDGMLWPIGRTTSIVS